MTTPNYANDDIYIEPARLCESAGYPVRYGSIDDDIYAHTREFNGIEMPQEDRFESSQHAAMVLGHELAHHLLASVFQNEKSPNYEADRALHVIVEAHCDITGAVLFNFAEMIALHKADQAAHEMFGNTQGGGDK